MELQLVDLGPFLGGCPFQSQGRTCLVPPSTCLVAPPQPLNVSVTHILSTVGSGPLFFFFRSAPAWAPANQALNPHFSLNHVVSLMLKLPSNAAGVVVLLRFQSYASNAASNTDANPA